MVDGLLVVEAVDMVLAPVQEVVLADMVVVVPVDQQEELILPEVMQQVTDLVEVVPQELVASLEEMDRVESL